MFINVTTENGTVHLRADRVESICPAELADRKVRSMVSMFNRGDDESWYVYEDVPTILDRVTKQLRGK